jgi:hypothetical protein
MAAPITSSRSAMAVLFILSEELEALQDKVEDLEDRGTKRQQKALPSVIEQCKRISALQSKTAELVWALEPTAFDDLSEVYDATYATFGGSK